MYSNNVKPTLLDKFDKFHRKTNKFVGKKFHDQGSYLI